MTSTEMKEVIIERPCSDCNRLLQLDLYYGNSQRCKTCCQKRNLHLANVAPVIVESAHYWDSQFATMIQPFQDLIDYANRIPLQRRMEAFQYLRSRLLPEAVASLDICINSIDTPANAMCSVQMDRLLYLLCLIIDEESYVVDMLNEQFVDMITGYCPSGRCCRIFQLVVYMEPTIREKVKKLGS